jgi:hypothetical protein
VDELFRFGGGGREAPGELLDVAGGTTTAGGGGDNTSGGACTRWVSIGGALLVVEGVDTADGAAVAAVGAELADDEVAAARDPSVRTIASAPPRARTTTTPATT